MNEASWDRRYPTTACRSVPALAEPVHVAVNRRRYQRIAPPFDALGGHHGVGGVQALAGAAVDPRRRRCDPRGRSEASVAAWRMRRLNPLVVRLIGATIDRTTVRTVADAGFFVERVSEVSGIVRLIETSVPGSAPDSPSDVRAIAASQGPDLDSLRPFANGSPAASWQTPARPGCRFPRLLRTIREDPEVAVRC